MINLLHLPSFSSQDLFAVRERMHESDQKPPTLPLHTAHPQQPSAPFSSVVQWSDLAALQTQLRKQNQVCYCLYLLKIKILVWYYIMQFY